MPDASGDSAPALPPKAPYSCCSGVAYFSRAMQQEGAKPICLGLKHVKEGVLQPDDAQNLPSGTQDYQFVCIGFSAHPSGEGADATAGSRALLPYCEGVEVISYTHAEASSDNNHSAETPAAAAAAAAAAGRVQPASQQQQQGHAGQQQQQQLLQERPGGAAEAGPSPSGGAEPGRGGGAAAGPSPRGGAEPGRGGSGPVSEPGSSDPEPGRRSFVDRFWARAELNADSMQKVLRNEGALRLRSFDSARDVYQRFWQVGAHNSSRMVSAAGFVRSTIAERCDLVWQAVCERIRK